MTTAPQTSQLPASQSAAELLDGLAALLPGRRTTRPTRRLLQLDTPDGRLDRRGASLTAEREEGGVRLRLDAGDDGQVLEARVGAAPDFVWELPHGALREALRPVVEMRRLLALVEVEREEVELAVHGAEAKTVVRLVLQSGRARVPGGDGSWTPLPSLLRVLPVRGYDEAYERALRVVESRPGLAPADAGPEGVALAAVGRAFPPSPGRLRAPLSADMRADEGLRRVHRAQLDVLLANEAGVRADTDSEFLHDYRVAVRRTRSVLGLVKRVFPEVAVEHYRAELKWLGSVTGPVRDLDVLLLMLRLPDDELPTEGLEALERFLEREQREAHGALVAALDEPRYGRLLDGWRRFLDEPVAPTADATDAARPLGAVVSARMAARHGKMLARGRAIHAGSPPEALHALRIEAKKLRYLLDAVRPLYPPEDVERPLGVLKKLQDVLGGYQDAAVQAGLLSAIGLRMAERGAADAGTLMALGRLLEHVEQRGTALRGRFAKRWRAFDDSAESDALQALFARHGEAAP